MEQYQAEKLTLSLVADMLLPGIQPIGPHGHCVPSTAAGGPE